VPIGTDLFSFGSRTNVLSRKLFGVTNEQIHSGHFYFASSHPMSIDHLHQVLSNSGLTIAFFSHLYDLGESKDL